MFTGISGSKTFLRLSQTASSLGLPVWPGCSAVPTEP